MTFTKTYKYSIMISLRSKYPISTCIWFLCIAYTIVARLLWTTNVLTFKQSIIFQSGICLLGFLLCAFEVSYQRVITRTPLLIWLIWIVYNGVYELTVECDTAVYYNAVFCFFIMSVVAYMSKKDFNYTLKLVVYALYISTILSLILLPAILSGTRDQNHLNINWTANNADFLVFFILLLSVREKWNFTKLALLCIIPVITIIMCASRKSFIALAIAFFYFYYSYLKTKDNTTRIIILITGLITLLGFYYLLGNSMVGERLADTGNADFTTYHATGTFWDKLDDRGIMYYYAIEIFKQHPVFGIGLGNFQKYFVIELVAHSEYIIQFCECGLVGFFLYILFYVKSIMALKQRRLFLPQIDKQTILLFWGGIVMVFFLSFSTWLYSVEVWACFMGLMIGYSNNNEIGIKLN